MRCSNHQITVDLPHSYVVSVAAERRILEVVRVLFFVSAAYQDVKVRGVEASASGSTKLRGIFAIVNTDPYSAAATTTER